MIYDGDDYSDPMRGIGYALVAVAVVALVAMLVAQVLMA